MSFLTSDKIAEKVRTAAAPARAGKASRALPTVNLLPTAQLEGLAVRRLRQRFLAAGLVGAVLVGGGWLLQTQRLNSAEERLAAEQALTPPLQAQVVALSPIAQFYDLLQARKQTASAAMAAEVLFSEALADLAGRTPAGVDITAMSVSLTSATVTAVAPPVSPLVEAGIDANGEELTANQTATGAQTPGATGAKGVTQPVSCARPDPFNPAPIIGCVTLTGTATNRAQVGQLVQNLRGADMYADPFVTTTTISGADGAESVAFAGSVGLTGEAVSGRYADLSWLSDPKVLAEAEKMIKEGNTASKRLAERAKADAAAAKAKADAEAAAKAKAEAKAQKDAEKQLAKQLEAAAAAAALAAQQAAQQAAPQAAQNANGE